MFLLRYQTYSTKEIKNLFYLFITLLFSLGELRAYKIKPVLFLYPFGLLAATKRLHKRKEKITLSKDVFLIYLYIIC